MLIRESYTSNQDESPSHSKKSTPFTKGVRLQTTSILHQIRSELSAGPLIGTVHRMYKGRGPRRRHRSTKFRPSPLEGKGTGRAQRYDGGIVLVILTCRGGAQVVCWRSLEGFFFIRVVCGHETENRLPSNHTTQHTSPAIQLDAGERFARKRNN